MSEYLGQWPETPYLGTRNYLPNRAPRATYAAMITRLDREIGSLVALVKELGLEENTLFIFTSDNGPLYDQLGGTDTDFFESAGALHGRKAGDSLTYPVVRGGAPDHDVHTAPERQTASILPGAAVEPMLGQSA